MIEFHNIFGRYLQPSTFDPRVKTQGYSNGIRKSVLSTAISIDLFRKIKLDQRGFSFQSLSRELFILQRNIFIHHPKYFYRLLLERVNQAYIHWLFLHAHKIIQRYQPPDCIHLRGENLSDVFLLLHIKLCMFFTIYKFLLIHIYQIVHNFQLAKERRK